MSKIPIAVSGQRLAKCMSWSGDLTPGLRRRRQSEKYVTDPSQLKLRFKRHSSSGKYPHTLPYVEIHLCWLFLSKNIQLKQHYTNIYFWPAKIKFVIIFH